MFFDVLEMNFDRNAHGMLAFFRGRSEFYSGFDRLLRKRVMETFAA